MVGNYWALLADFANFAAWRKRGIALLEGVVVTKRACLCGCSALAGAAGATAASGAVEHVWCGVWCGRRRISGVTATCDYMKRHCKGCARQVSHRYFTMVDVLKLLVVLCRTNAT
jgi:hypothetical protein